MPGADQLDEATVKVDGPRVGMVDCDGVHEGGSLSEDVRSVRT